MSQCFELFITMILHNNPYTIADSVSFFKLYCYINYYQLAVTNYCRPYTKIIIDFDYKQEFKLPDIFIEINN